jgi:hypothetical protein
MGKLVDALSILRGPTQGFLPAPPSQPTGGNILPIDKLSLISTQLLIIFILLMVPVAIYLYKRPGVLLKLFRLIH